MAPQPTSTAALDPDHRRQQRDRRRTGAALCQARVPVWRWQAAIRTVSPRSRPTAGAPAPGGRPMHRRDRPRRDGRLDRQGRSGCAARSGDRQRRHRRPASGARTGTHPGDLRGQPRRRAQYDRAGRDGHGGPRPRSAGVDELARELLRLAERTRLLQQQGGGAPARRGSAPAARAERHRGFGDLPRLRRDPDDCGHPSAPAVHDERRAGGGDHRARSGPRPSADRLSVRHLRRHAPACQATAGSGRAG